MFENIFNKVKALYQTISSKMSTMLERNTSEAVCNRLQMSDLMKRGQNMNLYCEKDGEVWEKKEARRFAQYMFVSGLLQKSRVQSFVEHKKNLQGNTAEGAMVLSEYYTSSLCPPIILARQSEPNCLTLPVSSDEEICTSSTITVVYSAVGMHHRMKY